MNRKRDDEDRDWIGLTGLMIFMLLLLFSLPRVIESLLDFNAIDV